MGWGDEIMLSGIAKRIHASTNESVGFVSANGVRRSDPIWQGIDYIAQHDAPAQSVLLSGRAHRPYYSHMEGNRIIWRTWDKAPGEIRLTQEEREWALIKTIGKRFVVVSPAWKAQGGGGSNKNWGFENWLRVVRDLLGDVECVQVGELPWLGGVHPIETPTFRHACAILERSIGYVGHEGGLHHAAAALGKPAVVVFGGYIAPAVTGYDTHQNLYSPDPRYPLGCGSVTPCEHCRESMSKITVEQVVNAVREMVRG